MSKMLARFWNDDEGAVISVELILILAVLVFGLIPGLVGLRNAVAQKLVDIGNAVTTVLINAGVSSIQVGSTDTIATAGGTGGGAQIDGASTDAITGYTNGFLIIEEPIYQGLNFDDPANQTNVPADYAITAAPFQTNPLVP